MKGKTSECLADFFKRFGRSLELAKFAKVAGQAECQWRVHGKSPLGETLLRVRYFLSFVGYEVAELETAPPALREVGLLIALDLVTVREVAEVIGEKHYQNLFAFFQGTRRISPSRMQALVKVASKGGEKQARLEQIKRELAVFSLPSKTGGKVPTIIEDFAAACERVRTLGQQLLEGPTAVRVAMRSKMCQGSEPLLNTTWQTLNQLLREKTGYEQQ